MNGLLCDIYKSGMSDCSNNGISARFNKVLLIGSGVNGAFDEEYAKEFNVPVCVLVTRNIPTKNGGQYLHVVPKEIQESGKNSMFGGAFIYTSDSRFPSNYPIAIHDRVE